MKIDWIQRVIKMFLLKILSWHVLLSIVKVKKRGMKKIDWFRQKLYGQQYILFRIDIYFTKYCLAVEIDEKGHTDRDLEFEKKKTRGIRKKT